MLLIVLILPPTLEEVIVALTIAASVALPTIGDALLVEVLPELSEDCELSDELELSEELPSSLDELEEELDDELDDELCTDELDDI